jgi:hypothetical protein
MDTQLFAGNWIFRNHKSLYKNKSDMKPIALAQQIMLLHSWARDNNGRTGKLGSPMVLPAHVKGEFYIPRNPEDNILQSEQTKFQIESFGIGEVFTSGIFFAVRNV